MRSDKIQKLRHLESPAASHELIQATLLSSSLTDSHTIDWVIAALEGCSLLYPRAELVLDFAQVQDISSAFLEELDHLREQVECRGGSLRFQAGGNGTKQALELPIRMKMIHDNPLSLGGKNLVQGGLGIVNGAS